MSTLRQAAAQAPSNIALVKYWGKRDEGLNLPQTGSLSVTLDALQTRTSVRFDPLLTADRIRLNGVLALPGRSRIERFLDHVRAVAGVELHAEVETENNFPTGAGLASSASGFAALTVACDQALGLGLSPAAQSRMARQGSGSAARSLYGGYVEMHPGQAADGSDAYAVPLAGPEQLPLALVIAITTTSAKSVGSSEGMRRSQRTSSFYTSWTRQVPLDLEAMRQAVLAGDLQRVGELAERNCTSMHAVAMSSTPPLLYWNPATVAAMHAVFELRRMGVGAWYTIDAGPQVKVLCAPRDVEAVSRGLADIPGVVELMHAAPGPGASVLEGVAS